MIILLQLNKINLNRVAISKHESNQLSGSIYAGGAIKHPYIVINVEALKMLFASNFMEAKGVVTVEDRFVSTESFEVDFEKKNIGKYLKKEKRIKNYWVKLIKKVRI